jgi:tetratricopeptide (TPR) repeat protein
VLVAATAIADDAPKPAAVEFGADLVVAQATAKKDGKPLLVLVVPKNAASPEAARLDKEILVSDESKKALDGFVRVRVAESEDREVHARRRLKFAGYPLALVLDADGSFLGSTSGLPAEDAAKTWPTRVAAIPVRAKKMKDLRATLAAKPEDPQTLFDLALCHVEADEPDRAVALFDRMESADPNGPADRLGEARYQVLRIESVRALAQMRFADVEPLCRKWLRRFETHVRAPDVHLIEANALFLTGEKDRAKEIWKSLVEKNAGTDAAKRAKAALDGL